MLRTRTGAARLTMQPPLAGLHLPPPFAARSQRERTGAAMTDPRTDTQQHSSRPDGCCRTSQTRWSRCTRSSSDADRPGSSRTSPAPTRCSASWTTRSSRPSARWSPWASSNASASHACSSRSRRPPQFIAAVETITGRTVRAFASATDPDQGGRHGELHLRTRAPSRRSATRNELTPRSLRRGGPGGWPGGPTRIFAVATTNLSAPGASLLHAGRSRRWGEIVWGARCKDAAAPSHGESHLSPGLRRTASVPRPAMR